MNVGEKDDLSIASAISRPCLNPINVGFTSLYVWGFTLIRQYHRATLVTGHLIQPGADRYRVGESRH